MGLIVSGLIGFASSLLFAYILYWLDRYEKEPLLLLGGVFLWGAVVAAGSAFIINTTLGLGIYIFTGSESCHRSGHRFRGCPAGRREPEGVGRAGGLPGLSE